MKRRIALVFGLMIVFGGIFMKKIEASVCVRDRMKLVGEMNRGYLIPGGSDSMVYLDANESTCDLKADSSIDGLTNNIKVTCNSDGSFSEELCDKECVYVDGKHTECAMTKNCQYSGIFYSGSKFDSKGEVKNDEIWDGTTVCDNDDKTILKCNASKNGTFEETDTICGETAGTKGTVCVNHIGAFGKKNASCDAAACLNSYGEITDYQGDVRCSSDGQMVITCDKGEWTDDISVEDYFSGKGVDGCVECVSDSLDNILCKKQGEYTLCDRYLDSSGKLVDYNTSSRIGGSVCIYNKIYACDSYPVYTEGGECVGEKPKCYIDKITGNAICGTNGEASENGYVSPQAINIDAYDPSMGCGANQTNVAGWCFPYDANGIASKLIQIIFGIAGGIAFLLMVYGFIMVATSSGDEKKLQAAKETITSAIVGLLVSIFALFLFRLIVVNILQIPGIS
jgi:hypothetical protein